MRGLINKITDRKAAPIKPSFDWIKVIYVAVGICNYCIFAYLSNQIKSQKIVFGIIFICLCLHFFIYVSAYRYRLTKRIFLTFREIFKQLEEYRLGEDLEESLQSWAKDELKLWLAKGVPYDYDGSNNRTTTAQIVKIYNSNTAALILIYLQFELLLYELSNDSFIWKIEDIDTNKINEDNAILSDTGYSMVSYMISILNMLNRMVTLLQKHYLKPNFYQSQKQLLESIKETKKYPKAIWSRTLWSQLRCTVIAIP